MKIYVGCAIHGLNEADWKEFSKELDHVKKELTRLDHQILDFHATDPFKQSASAAEIFAWDYKQCMDCDAMIAISNSPSTGMGMEIALCLYGRKEAVPVFATALSGTSVSNMVIGCDHPLFTFEYCDQLADIPGLFEKYIQALKKIA